MRSWFSLGVTWALASACGARALPIGADSGGSRDEAGSGERDAAASDGGGPPTPCVETVEGAGRWVAEDLDVGADATMSMVIDARDFLHVALVDQGTESTQYASDASGEWVTESIEADTGSYGSSIALDPDGDIHVVYGSRQPPVGLRHAWRRAGAWSIEVIPDASDAGFPAMAIDARGTLHLTYYDYTGQLGDVPGIRYATGNWEDWATEDLVRGEVDYGSSIAVDPAGAVHVLYLAHLAGQPAYELVHGTNASGEWEMDTVDPMLGETLGRRPAIGVGPSGRLHVAYTYFAPDGGEPPEIRYATRDDLGAWAITTVDSTAAVIATAVWLALDGDAAHIAYDFIAWGPKGFDEDASHFRHATNSCGCWQIDAIDELWTYGSIGVGAAGALHALYWSPAGPRHARQPATDCSAPST